MGYLDKDGNPTKKAEGVNYYFSSLITIVLESNMITTLWLKGSRYTIRLMGFHYIEIIILR